MRHHQTPQDEGDNNEVIISGRGTLHVQVDTPMRMVKAWMMVKQRVMMATIIRHLDTQLVDYIAKEDLAVVVDLKGLRIYETMDPVFINLHVKYPVFSAKDDEDAEKNLLQSNAWINSQGIAEDAKCGRFCLTLGSDTCHGMNQ